MAQLEEVYSQLVPLQGGRMIVPRTAVIEVMGWNTPKHPVADAPPWLLGLLEWQGNRIPLVSFEAACGDPVPSAKNRTRIAVMQAIGGVLEPPAFALATQGYPYLLRVNVNVMRPDEDAGQLAGPVLTRVRMANERPMIPDLERLEAMIAEALGIEAPQPEVPAEEFDPDALTGAAEIVLDDGDMPGDEVLDDGLDPLEETVPDPSAPPEAHVPGELTGLDETQPAIETDDGDAIELEDGALDAGLEVGELGEAALETGEVEADGDGEDYEISIDDLGLDDEPAG